MRYIVLYLSSYKKEYRIIVLNVIVNNLFELCSKIEPLHINIRSNSQSQHTQKKPAQLFIEIETDQHIQYKFVAAFDCAIETRDGDSVTITDIYDLTYY